MSINVTPIVTDELDFLEDMMSPEAEADLEEQCRLWLYEKGLE